MSDIDARKPPCDWDGVSYCTRRDGNPATHRRIYGMAGTTPIVEMLCCDCAVKDD